jgi:hypothetical protein
MKLTLDWVLARLSETSTWRGIILVITAAGVTIRPELANQIVALGLAVVGLINIVRKERHETHSPSSGGDVVP